ncbi:MAG TPA: ATP-binding protein [Terriglobales bacterium]|jgi:serine/threonine-protein kinase RsbW|nr:ATP-binding protein [Terriglobales bacterium]
MADEPGAGESSTFTELLNLSMPANSESISTIIGAISEILERLDIPEQKRLEIDLAVQEALANAVVHGCKGDASKTIRCRLNGDQQGRVVISVTDPGPGFRPEIVPDPKRAEGLYGDHGRGVYLIRQLMDEVQFERGGAEIKMWKY